MSKCRAPLLLNLLTFRCWGESIALTKCHSAIKWKCKAFVLKLFRWILFGISGMQSKPITISEVVSLYCYKKCATRRLDTSKWEVFLIEQLKYRANLCCLLLVPTSGFIQKRSHTPHDIKLLYFLSHYSETTSWECQWQQCFLHFHSDRFFEIENYNLGFAGVVVPPIWDHRNLRTWHSESTSIRLSHSVRWSRNGQNGIGRL